MKKFRKKLAKILERIYGIGIFVSLSIGTLSFFGYVIAIIIGGSMATQICTIIYEGVYPVLFYCTSVIVLLGLVKMYVAGEKALTIDNHEK